MTLNYDAAAQQRRTIGKMTLRDHVLRATLCGDFVNCVVAAGTLHIDVTTVDGSRRVTHSRAWPLDCFPSIRDMLHADPDWLPNVELDFA